MRTLVIAGSLTVLAFAGGAHAKSSAANDRMKVCSSQWADMKKSGQAKGMKYSDFSKTCLSSPASTVATAPAAPAPMAKAPPAASPAPMAKPAPAPTPMSSARATTPVVTTGGAAPMGATAKCKDGTFSMSKHHSGSCSHHGGVATFL